MRRLVPAAAVFALAFPSTALAATAGSGLTGPVFQAGALEANWLTVTNLASGKFQFRDFTAGVLAQASCTSTLAGSGAECAHADAGEALIFLGDRDDTLLSYLDGAVGAHVDGGTGNDHLTGGYADDRLSGGPDNDVSAGGPGNDILDDAFVALGTSDPGAGDDTQQGDDGDDTIIAGPGTDTIDGGAQTDTLDYSSYSAPLTVTVDAGSHDDGAPGEHDTVKGIERVLGGTGADALTAGPAPSRLAGGAGDDQLTGGAGADALLGDDEAGSAGSGNDVLDGGGGADTLRGGDGLDTATYAGRATAVTVTLDDRADDGQAAEADNVRSDVENVVGGVGADTLVGSATANVLTGGAGDDRLTGASGTDTLDGGAGDDVLDAADGSPDTIACGAGEDIAKVDAQDAVAADCEHVDAPAVPVAAGTAATATPTPQGAPTLLLAGGSLKLRARRRVHVLVGCAAQTAGCAGRATLRPRTGSALASASFRLAPGAVRALTLTLSRPAARRVRRAHRLAATFSATDGMATSSVIVTLTA